MPAPEFPPLVGAALTRQIAPTDVSQFIRLDQCARYLRLRLHERSRGTGFMREYDVRPQSIPALLTRSGQRFELATEERVRAVAASQPNLATRNLASERDRSHGWTDDNATIATLARDLRPDGILVLFQPRLRVELDGWLIRGDVDILRLERDGDGALRVTIADMKSTTVAKVEHRLQVAFYHEMLQALFAREQISCVEIAMAILYRGPAADDPRQSDEDRERQTAQRAAARALFGVDDALLEIIGDPQHYLSVVRDLVTDQGSAAERAASLPFEQVPYHLSYKCDGCLYNELCMKWSAEHDSIALLPHVTLQEKLALERAGMSTIADLARLKEPLPDDRTALVSVPGRESLAEQLATTWPVGPRLDELIHRARRYRGWKYHDTDALSYIPSKGYGSLPFADASQNPNLARIYVDAQHDYLHDRIYLLGALLVGCEGGEEQPHRRRSVVRMTDGPPDTPEAEEALFVDWLREVLLALVTVAAPDDEGRPRAPIHLIFYNSFEQRLLLDGLKRNFERIREATPIYDFVTQLAAFDSSLVSYLDHEIRELKNYPMVCQSLQAVAAYLGFDWNAPEPYRQLFRARLFDFWGKLERPDGDNEWYTSRSRFNSQLPLEYAYGIWGELGEPEDADQEDYRRYRGVTREQIIGFHARRLEALEHVAHDFRGNHQTVKTAFEIPDIVNFVDRSPTLAHALQEFVTIERHVDLAAWKTSRNLAPERRALAGTTLLVRYLEADQDPEVVERSREMERRRVVREQVVAAWRAANPGKKLSLPKEDQDATKWSLKDLRVRLRIETTDVGCPLDELLGLTTFRDGDAILVSPRVDVDSRPGPTFGNRYTPTPKSMLYAMRGYLREIEVSERDAEGRALAAFAIVELHDGNRHGERGYVFTTMGDKHRPLVADELYMLDPDPNDWMGSHSAGIARGLVAGGRNTLFARLDGADGSVDWPDAAREGQARFMAGLESLHAAGALHDFEPGKHAFIGAHGDDPILLVQGPPGTGKSYSTAFAIFARLQGAMAAGMPCRVVVACKTHAAVDVLLHNVRHVRRMLEALRAQEPSIFARYIDPRLLEVDLFRIRPNEPVEPPIESLPRDSDLPAGSAKANDRIQASEWCVVGATPGGVRGLIVDTHSTKALFGHEMYDLLVLDEASQMNLPEAVMAALGLKVAGQLIVVGDHRQMPPILKHDWANERRRTFAVFRTYESLFETLLQRQLPIIRFERSFRLHRDMAEFLRRAIYRYDGIPYHSEEQRVLPEIADDDPFVRAVLVPECPIVVVVHDEESSQLQNRFEQELMAPVLRALATNPLLPLNPVDGLGVVVPHRAQRAAMRRGIPELTIETTEGELTSSVETVERFQGGERIAIVYSATESDPQYLLVASKFLMDPRRLTVALSRAKQKMIVVASRSVFNVFSADEETFVNAQLWKDLLRQTCTLPLWQGERAFGWDGGVLHRIEVWGNPPLAPADPPVDAARAVAVADGG